VKGKKDREKEQGKKGREKGRGKNRAGRRGKRTGRGCRWGEWISDAFQDHDVFAVDVFFAVEAEAVVGVEGGGRGVAGDDAEVDATAVVFGLETVDEEAHGFFAVAFVLVALVYEEAVHPYSSGGEVFGEEAVHGKAYEESVVVDGYGAPAGTGIGFLQALFDAFYIGFLAEGCFEGEGFFAVGCRDWLEGEVHGVWIPFCLLFL